MKSASPESENRTRRLWSWLPSSLISVSVHALILIVAGVSLKGCEKGAPAEAGGREFRDIGLAVLPDSSQPSDNPHQETPQDAESDTPSELENEQVVQNSIPTEAPNLAELLNQQNADRTSEADNAEHPEVVGAGLPTGALPEAGTGIPELIRPRSSAGTGPGGSLTPGPNETSFMNIVGNGRSFVYVIDISSSMGSGGRLNLAKSQLKSSLRLLKPNQEFQVLFYSYTTTQMKLRNRPADALYAATAVQVHLAEDEIDRVTPNGGTEHLQPILHALRLEPDVIYFLTDGDQPTLSRTELARIRRENRSGACIHVIEFASGAKESRDLSWLQLLAGQSHGKYSYIPIRD